MSERLSIHDIPAAEKRLITRFRMRNLQVAGDDNPYQAFGKFSVVAYPDIPQIRNKFLFETPNGRVWRLEKIFPREQQVMVQSANQGNHVDIWGKNKKVRLHILEDEETQKVLPI